MKKLIAASLAAFFVAGTASAITVDFENEGLSPNDRNSVGTSYSNGGITFESLDGNDLFLVGSNGNTGGFVPSDRVTPLGQFGTGFLTGDFQNNSSMKLTFAQQSNIAFDIADIDGSGGQREIFTFEFLLGGIVQNTIFRTPGDGFVPAVDGGITRVSYFGDVDEVRITNRTQNSASGSNRNIGWGIDNISVVPLPAGLVLTLTALGGLGVVGARRRKS